MSFAIFLLAVLVAVFDEKAFAKVKLERLFATKLTLVSHVVFRLRFIRSVLFDERSATRAVVNLDY
jgi:hypothetical protein